jgi:transposase-like protein
LSISFLRIRATLCKKKQRWKPKRCQKKFQIFKLRPLPL